MQSITGEWLILKDLLNEWVAEGVASEIHDFTFDMSMAAPKKQLRRW